MSHYELSGLGFVSGVTSDVDEDDDDVSVAPRTTSKLLPALQSPNAYAVSMQPESPNSCNKEERTLFTEMRLGVAPAPKAVQGHTFGQYDRRRSRQRSLCRFVQPSRATANAARSYPGMNRHVEASCSGRNQGNMSSAETGPTSM